jgi:ethanolaminephosphotransferase
VPFVFFVGLINAYSVGQIIVAHLTKSPFPYTNVLVLPLFFAVLDSAGPLLRRYTVVVGWPSALGYGVYQVSYMFLCLGLAVGVYSSFVVDVIYTICDYLDIYCLSIKHPWDPAKEAGEGKKVL